MYRGVVPPWGRAKGTYQPVIADDPQKKADKAATGKLNSGSTPVAWAVRRPEYMPIIKNSPWAKFTMSITPKMMVRPRATRPDHAHHQTGYQALSKISMNRVPL